MSPLSISLAAGAAGTAAVSQFGRFERRLLGREPVYSPRLVTARVLRRLLRKRPSPRQAAAAGALMRWIYGPAWGVVFGLVRERLPAGFLARALLQGLLLGASELLVMPRVGATPRLRHWRPTEVALLLAQTLAFGWAAENTFRKLLAQQPEAGRSRRFIYSGTPPPLRPTTSGARLPKRG